MTTANLNAAIEAARRKVAGNAKWTRSVEKAVSALLNGEIIVTVLVNGGIVTSANGTYRITNGYCSCPAALNGCGHCYHVSALRICALADEAPAPVSAPRITRSWYGQRDRNAMIVNGWAV